MSIERVVLEDHQSAQQQPSAAQTKQPIDLCPYCRKSSLVSGRCVNCGSICGRCGTPYHADYCPVCWGEELDEGARFQVVAGPSAGPTPHGDSAPSRSGLKSIIDHTASVKEHNIARGIHVDAMEKAVHDRASAAVAQLDISPEKRARILDDVEREAVAIRKRVKKNDIGDDHGRKNGGITLEKAVAFAFLRQCRGVGRSVEEMQRALARAGFGIRLESIHITVATRDPENLRLFVSGRERSVKISRSPKLVRVPIYLTDLMERTSDGRGAADGPEEGEVEIRIGGEGAIIDVRSPYEFIQTDWQSLRVFAGRRCFYLFKTQKDVTIAPDWVVTGASALYPPLSVNIEGVMKRFSPSKFPISSMLMNSAGCLREVELRFADLFREMIKDTHGRAPENVAADALYMADQNIFDSLLDAKKNLVRSMIIKMGLAGSRYLGKRGLLLKREVGFDERIFPGQREETGGGGRQ